MILRLLACLLVAATSLSAHAIIVTGSFTGAVSRVLTPAGESTVGLGEPVKGTFFLDTQYFTYTETEEATWSEYTFFNVDPTVRSLELVFDYGNGPIVQNLGAQTVRLERQAELQTLYLSNYYPGGYGASLSLAANAGTLFSSSSIDSILGGADIDLPRSRAYTGSYLEDAGNAGSFIALNSADIRVGEVPEPGSLSMLVLGLGIGGLWRMRRQRSAA